MQIAQQLSPERKKLKEIHPKKENKSSLSDVNRHIIRDLMAPIPGVYHAVNWRIIDHRIPLVFIRKWYIHEFKCLWTKIIINIQLCSTTPDFCENLRKWKIFRQKFRKNYDFFYQFSAKNFIVSYVSSSNMAKNTYLAEIFAHFLLFCFISLKETWFLHYLVKSSYEKP